MQDDRNEKRGRPFAGGGSDAERGALFHEAISRLKKGRGPATSPKPAPSRPAPLVLRPRRLPALRLGPEAVADLRPGPPRET